MKTKKTKNVMTIQERVGLLYGDGFWKVRGVKSLGLPGIEMHDGPLGLRIPENPSNITDMGAAKPATCYPSPALLACSFDRNLLNEYGKTIGLECRQNNTNILLGPGVNIKRNPLCGRNFEYYSEDPLLSGKLGAAFVKGLQSQGVGACVKHFACNNQEYFRMVNDSVVDERALHEIYLKPFEIVVKEGNPAAIMASYNKINGIYACDNAHLLLDTLKEKWRYGGVVMSDWGACNDYLLNHNHGLDLEMPGTVDRKKDLLRAIRHNKIVTRRVVESSDRVRKMLEKYGHPAETPAIAQKDLHAFALKAAKESIVLLKNDAMLPFKNYKDTCVIGEFARTPRYQGAGSSIVNAKPISFLEATKEFDLPFGAGFTMEDKQDDSLYVEAMDLANKSKKVILFLGIPPKMESEGYDRSTLCLPDNQLRLFDALYKINPNIVVVLSCGAPVEMPFKDRAKAIVLTYLAGEACGEAVSDILLGNANPSGKLSESWPIHFANCPNFGFYPGSEVQSLYRESIYVGYRYYLTAGVPVNFPFGFGLSYSKFKFTKPALSSTTLDEDCAIKVSFEVSNVSKRDGAVVIQIYIEPQGGNSFKPLRTLINFDKLFLKAGETKTFEFKVNHADFAHYDTVSHSFKVEGGTYAIQVGDSCESILQQAKIKVVSHDAFTSKKQSCPVYYNPTKEGFIQYENDFEYLLGRPLKLAPDPRTPPYTENSTISDISGTGIGKKLVKKISGLNPDPKNMDSKNAVDVALQLPLRGMSMAGIKPKTIRMIVLMANRKFFSLIITALFRRH
ncbi:MAG: glycoside hydrolase family 3 C-terminal domain-containing protein [Bacilli bacterium]|nr:glycoside hydrolase family 3 C-terminal domain-containing protein [Bacilli bacterium]